MNGILKTCVLGKVTDTADGTTKQGKAWFRASLAVNIYTGRKDNPYENVFVNVVGFDKLAESMKKQITKGCAVYAEGQVKPGKPFKTNSGAEFTPLDLIARDWSIAGIVPDRFSEPKVEEPVEDDNPFA